MNSKVKAYKHTEHQTEEPAKKRDLKVLFQVPHDPCDGLQSNAHKSRQELTLTEGDLLL